jgi:hypothetical protein
VRGRAFGRACEGAIGSERKGGGGVENIAGEGSMGGG